MFPLIIQSLCRLIVCVFVIANVGSVLVHTCYLKYVCREAKCDVSDAQRKWNEEIKGRNGRRVKHVAERLEWFLIPGLRVQSNYLV